MFFFRVMVITIVIAISVFLICAFRDDLSKLNADTWYGKKSTIGILHDWILPISLVMGSLLVALLRKK
jgi:hypothetical protein